MAYLMGKPQVEEINVRGVEPVSIDDPRQRRHDRHVAQRFL